MVERSGVVELQRFGFPDPSLCSDELLYVRCADGARSSQVSSSVSMVRGSTVRLDTYFNSFSIGKWRRHTEVRSVVPFVRVRGECEVEAVVDHPHRARRVVAAARHDGSNELFELPALDLDELGDGLLSLTVHCLSEEAVLVGGGFATTDPRCRDVHLGVVITTYNRQQYVRRNMDRVARSLKNTEGFQDRLEVVIVDNGSNLELDLPADAPVTVLPNRNIGGSGGFARGLMHHRASGSVTHALVMDDDTSFDPEALFRTVELLSYATDPDLCLAGAMLIEEEPHFQLESGGSFDAKSLFPVKPIGHHLDMRHLDNLISNDEERRISYSAWWYTCFPFSLSSANPVPLFVRGEDVLYGLQHTGPHTITLNGIAVWHQNFAQKHAPVAYYYELRNLAVISSLTSDAFSAIDLAKRFVYYTSKLLLSMKYDSAAAAIDGMNHFLDGPDAWLERDPEQTHKELRELYQLERQLPLDVDQMNMGKTPDRGSISSAAERMLAAALLSGHLLPRRLSRRAPVAYDMLAWPTGTVVGREQVLYRDDVTGDGFVATRDRARFFALARAAARTSSRIASEFTFTKSAYRAAYDAMTSDAYWQGQFD